MFILNTSHSISFLNYYTVKHLNCLISMYYTICLVSVKLLYKMDFSNKRVMNYEDKRNTRQKGVIGKIIATFFLK